VLAVSKRKITTFLIKCILKKRQALVKFMFTSQIKFKYKKFAKRRLCQGDILKNIGFNIGEVGYGSRGNTGDLIVLKYGVVMSQDCDINSDFRNREEKRVDDETDNDKYLPTILICPAYVSGEFCAGEHILGWKMKGFNEGEFKKIIKNDQFKRFHYLSSESALSVPELIIDFKHFFTLPVEMLYKNKKKYYLATICEVFREELSQRFAAYLARFGLPELKK
jgi:hypothetical protein